MVRFLLHCKESPNTFPWNAKMHTIKIKFKHYHKFRTRQTTKRLFIILFPLSKSHSTWYSLIWYIHDGIFFLFNIFIILSKVVCVPCYTRYESQCTFYMYASSIILFTLSNIWKLRQNIVIILWIRAFKCFFHGTFCWKIAEKNILMVHTVVYWGMFCWLPVTNLY